MEIKHLLKLKHKYCLESSLNLLYSIFNKLLFRNKLPHVKVKVANFESKDYRGIFSYDKDTNKPIGIIINKLDKDPVKVLIHEMVHVYWTIVKRHLTGEEHPPGFVRVLRSKYRKLGYSPDRYELSND